MNVANCRLPASKGTITYPKVRGPLEKPTPEIVQTIDLEKSTHDEKQEHIIEPGHYYGISR